MTVSLTREQLDRADTPVNRVPAKARSRDGLDKEAGIPLQPVHAWPNIGDQVRPRGSTVVDFRSPALVLFTVSVAVAGIFSSIVNGQQPEVGSRVDFTQWLQNRSYERFGYGDEGELKTHQLIQFGELAPQETGCVLPVRTISFDVDDPSHVKGDTELSLFVECSNPHLVANILKFVGDFDRQHVEAKVIGDELAYPEAPQDGMNLPDLHYTAMVKRGFLAVLGTKVTVLVTERRVSVPPPEIADGLQPQIYEIHSKISMRISIIGLPVKKEGISSHLVVDPISGPVEEILEHDNGARTEIRTVAPLNVAPSSQ